MAKKPSININNGPLAAGFFSGEKIPEIEKENTVAIEKPTNNQQTNKPEKNKGGRPKKENKKKQYTLTMDPDLYEKLKTEADQRHTSFSQLITTVMLEYLENN